MPRQASLSIDLLRTFLLLIKEEGDAASTARILGINQPSMSKRLGLLQHAGRALRRPWLVRKGKTWLATEEGRRVGLALSYAVFLGICLTLSSATLAQLEHPGPTLGAGPSVKSK